MNRARIVNHPILGTKPERRQVPFVFDGRPMQGLVRRATRGCAAGKRCAFAEKA